MLDAWLNRTRDWLKIPDTLLPLPEQEFAQWALSRAAKQSRPGPLSCPLLHVWGDPGCGKSSLVRQALRPYSTVRRRAVIAASAVEWSFWLADESNADSFLWAPSHLELLICDNLQDLNDLSGDSQRLASWFDAAVAARVPVIVTADRLPSQISNLSPRLVNRLQGGLFAGIRPLSGESKQRLWDSWTSRTSPQPSASHAFLLNDPSITAAGQLRSFLDPDERREQTLRQQSLSEPDPQLLEMVADAVSRDFQVSVADLRSGARTRNLRIPRDLAMSLARELTPYPLAAIGRFFGCRSHTSVTRSCSRLQQLVLDAPSLRQQLQILRAKLRQELSSDCG
jgi:chromosomal replication initiator protein